MIYRDRKIYYGTLAGFRDCVYCVDPDLRSYQTIKGDGMTPTLREIVGEESYLRLQAEYGGQKLYIPKEGCGKEEIIRRNNQIKKKYQELTQRGITSSSAIQQLVCEYAISDTRIRHILD